DPEVTYYERLRLFNLPGYSQDKYKWKESNSKGYTYKYVSNDPMKARIYTLNNGLTVMLTVNNKEPRIRSLIAVRAGSNNDPKDHTGLAHYLEHLLFKGTYTFGSLDSSKEKVYIDEIEGLYDIYNKTTDTAQRMVLYHQIDSVSGIAAKYAIPNEYEKMASAMGSQQTNAHTGVEETVYEENIPANSVDKYLALQAERFNNPVFRLFHTELEAVYEEKNRTLDDDNRKVWYTILRALFPTSNYGQQTTIGTIEHLKNPSLIAIRQFYNKYYVPDNMALIMAGDFNPDELIKKIDAAFSYMIPSAIPEYTSPQEQPITVPFEKEVVGPESESVKIGYRFPGVQDNKAIIDLTVVSQLLANGKAGLMDINLNKKQVVLSSNAEPDYYKDYSALFLNGKPKGGQSLEQVKDLLLSQVELLSKGEFDQTLIKAIVSNFKLSELQGMESNDSRANSLMTSFIAHKGLLYNQDVAAVDDLSKVTKQEIVDFSNKYLRNNYVVVYKRKGEDKSIVKVQKPIITPITINTNDQSAFLKKVNSMPVDPIHPKWIDFKKEIITSKTGNAQLLYVQNKDNEIFRLHYRLDLGTWNSRELALAAGYLQFLGDDKHTSEEISRAFYNIACSFAITPSSEYTTITITGLQENFGKAVKLFEDLVLHCRPDEAALKNLKARILKQRSDAKSNKNSITRGLTYYAMYGPINPFNYQLSTEELNAVTPQKLVDFIHLWFQYKHVVLYYGPRSLSAVSDEISKIHKVPSRFQELPAGVTFRKQDVPVTKVIFTSYDMVQSEIYWISNSGTFDSSKTATIDLFNKYFGTDMSSVVFQVIRESKALAYSTFAFYAQPDKREGRYTTIAYVGSQADKMKEGISAMNELLQTLPETDKAFESAKTSLQQDLASERVTQDAIIFSYLAAKRLGLTTDLRKTEYESIPAIKFNDIKNFHQQTIAS
ncbi:MAG: insulinase family protein, partial [Flavitalea sp.]